MEIKDGVHCRKATRRTGHAGVRAPIVAMKRRNWRGAKGAQEGGCVKDRTTEAQPASVPPGAMQAGEARSRWAWVEPSVWTDRMLAALEDGVKGGKWFSLIDVLEPIFERDFAAHSYGFRPGRGCKDALRRVDGLLKAGSTWVVDVDLKSYFDSIPHEQLMARVEAKVADGRVLGLIEAYLKADVMDALCRWTPQQGCPQGAVLSPLLSNVYLDELDHEMARLGYEMIRYADDFVILCRSEQEARDALEQVRQWTADAGLMLHPEKTRIVDATQRGGFDFLGYHFERGHRWPRKKSMHKLRDAIRAKTRRTNGHSLKDIIRSVNQTTRGWFGYFKHSHRSTFQTVDGWVRMRLRSILRRRAGRRGRGRGRDHQRWPNAFFATCGLFSLTAAYKAACRPPPG